MRDGNRLTSIGNAEGPSAWPYRTGALPGIGGSLKRHPEDFQVEEIPAYLPAGQGEHLFLWIEKRDVSAEHLVRHVSRVLGISQREVGTAGLKDRRAVTRQYVSVPDRCAGRIAQLETDGIRVLTHGLHRNKLKTGHLRGNRFSILVREPDGDALRRAEAVREVIEKEGFPNYFGPQRFGQGGETLQTGLDLLSGRRRPQDLPRSRGKFLTRLGISAAQAYLFNCCLAERIEDRLLGRVLAGDVMQVVSSGGTFVAENVDFEQSRSDRGETAATGPIYGPKMKQPAGEPAEREQRVLEKSGLAVEDFAKFHRLARGTRRPYAVRPEELKIAREEEGLRFRLTLPPGTYATSLLREFMKTE